jgi:hypothetical protein
MKTRSFNGHRRQDSVLGNSLVPTVANPPSLRLPRKIITAVRCANAPEANAPRPLHVTFSRSVRFIIRIFRSPIPPLAQSSRSKRGSVAANFCAAGRPRRDVTQTVSNL